MPRAPRGKPGVYFRMMMEGIGLRRGITWRCAGTIPLYPGRGLPETRKRLSVEAVFGHALALPQESDLPRSKTLGVDATTLRTVVRCAGCGAWLRQASGIGAPARKDLAKLGRNNSKKERAHPEARTTKMKGGRVHLAHQFEQAAGVVQAMDGGDTAPPLAEAQAVVAGKGCHSNQTVTGVRARGLRSYISEPRRGRRGVQHPTCVSWWRTQGSVCCVGTTRKRERICAPALDRRVASDLCSRTGGYTKTAKCCLQPRSPDVQAVRDSHSAGSRGGASCARKACQFRCTAHFPPPRRLFRPQDPFWARTLPVSVLVPLFHPVRWNSIFPRAAMVWKQPMYYIMASAQP